MGNLLSTYLSFRNYARRSRSHAPHGDAVFDTLSRQFSFDGERPRSGQDRIEGFGLRGVGVVGGADLGRQDDEGQTDDQAPRRKPCARKPHGPALRGPGRSVHCSIAISLSWISVPEQFPVPGGTLIASNALTLFYTRQPYPIQGAVIRWGDIDLGVAWLRHASS